MKRTVFVLMVAFWIGAALPVSAAVTSPKPNAPIECSRWYWPLC